MDARESAIFVFQLVKPILQTITHLIKTTNEETKFRLKIYRNRIMTEIHRERKQEENVKINIFIQPLLDNQNENQRMYEAVKNINKIRQKHPLVIKSYEGLTTNGETQTKIIAKYFNDIFRKDTEPTPDLRPAVTCNPFTSDEIKKAVSKMKMNKSPGAMKYQFN